MDVLFNPFSIARRTKRPLILDGAIGSLLQARGVPKDEYLWMSLASITSPEKVIELHKEYIEAGADIITTNTFRTNPSAKKEYSTNSGNMLIDLHGFVSKSVELAKIATEGTPVLIAGSNPPAEDCYQREVKLTLNDYYWNHELHIKKLFLKGCHFILNETQSHLIEIEKISRICDKEDIPFVMSLFFDKDFNLLSGQSVDEAINLVLKYKPLAIGFNCISSETFLSFIKERKFNFNWGVYLNAGSGELTDSKITACISPEEYQKIIRKILKYNPSFIGGCCGTTPDHIRKIKELLDERTVN
jgi:methionine synthase I (cobalamin-dependent)